MVARVVVATALAAVAALITGGVVDGGVAGSLMLTGRVVLTAVLEGDRMGVELRKRHDVQAGGGGSDERLVVTVEASDDDGDDVLIAHRATGNSKVISIHPNLGEVINHGHVALAEGSHLKFYLDNTSLGVGDVHLLKVFPDLTRGCEQNHLFKDVVAEGGHQIAEDGLILTEPVSIRGVGRPHSFVISRKELIKSLNRAVDVADSVGDAHRRKNLRLPHEVVGVGEAGGDETSRGSRDRRARRGG